MPNVRVQGQSLLPQGSRIPGDIELYKWLPHESIKELIRDYYKHIPGAPERPCGIACIKTYNFFRTSIKHFTKYCKRIRSCKEGRDACRISDYVGAILAANYKRPHLYCCLGYAYDFTIPLRRQDHSDTVIGVFIDGQLRPRIPLRSHVESLCEKYKLGTELPESYHEMPILDYQRASLITDYLYDEFAEKLKFHNRCRAKVQDLNIEAFKSDVKLLGSLLKRAANDGLVKPIWQFPEMLDLDKWFCEIPLVAVSDGHRDNGYHFELGLQHHKLKQLRCNLSTIGYRELKRFEEEVKQFRTPTVLNSSEEHSYIKNLLNQYFLLCYSAENGYKGSKKKLQDIKEKTQWLVAGVQDGDQIGFLSIAGTCKDELECLTEKAKVTSGRISGYIEKYTLAKMLTRACGEGDTELTKKTRKKLFDDVYCKITTLASTRDKIYIIGSKPLLKDISDSLGRISDPNSLEDYERRDFDKYVIPALGNPYYSPLEHLRASRWLRNFKRTTKRKLERKPQRDKQPIFEMIGDYESDIKLIEQELRLLEDRKRTPGE